MARQNGRDLRMKKGTTVIAVANTKTMTINTNPVDVTGDDDEGFVTMLARPGTRQMTMDISGFTTDTVLRDAAMGFEAAGTILDAYTVEWLAADGTGDVVYAITGNFVLSNYSETGASDGGLEFSASLQSSGQFAQVTA